MSVLAHWRSRSSAITSSTWEAGACGFRRAAPACSRPGLWRPTVERRLGLRRQPSFPRFNVCSLILSTHPEQLPCAEHSTTYWERGHALAFCPHGEPENK